MASKLCIALFTMLATIVLLGCGGSGEVVPAACQTTPPLPVVKISYPNESAPIGANVNVVPSIDLTTGDGVNAAILRFDLIDGSLPSGLSLNPTTGQISGKVAGVSGSFSYTVRMSADCFTGTVTTSAVFLVN